MKLPTYARAEDCGSGDHAASFTGDNGEAVVVQLLQLYRGHWLMAYWRADPRGSGSTAADLRKVIEVAAALLDSICADAPLSVAKSSP